MLRERRKRRPQRWPERSDAKALGPLWYRAETQNQLRFPTLSHVSSPHANPSDFRIHELSGHIFFIALFVKIAGFLMARLDHVRKGCSGRVVRSKPWGLLEEILTGVDILLRAGADFHRLWSKHSQAG